MLHQNSKMGLARIGPEGKALIALQVARGSGPKQDGVEVNSSSSLTQGLEGTAARQREWTSDPPILTEYHGMTIFMIQGVTIMIRMSGKSFTR